MYGYWIARRGDSGHCVYVACLCIGPLIWFDTFALAACADIVRVRTRNDLPFEHV